MTAQSLSFNEVSFSLVKRQNQIWLTGVQIGEALGYHNPAKKIHELYTRHADEFSPTMTLTPKLGVKGFGNGSSKRTVRIFSLRGAHLLAMFARTPVAKEFRRWVLDILDREVGNGTAPKRYHFPLSMADPHDRMCGTAWLTPRVLLDPKNATPELDLIKALERDGHDVMGAKLRIIALRDAAEDYLILKKEVAKMTRMLRNTLEAVEGWNQERGKNVCFVKLSENSAINRLVYGDQFPVIG